PVWVANAGAVTRRVPWGSFDEVLISSRQLSLTQEGQVLHEKAQAMLATVESGLDEINTSSKEPHGTLRVTAPAFATQTG
ncbi:MAG: hypothetical protein AAFQ33_13465, partial [Pseudomonadota bacterium]